MEKEIISNPMRPPKDQKVNRDAQHKAYNQEIIKNETPNQIGKLLEPYHFIYQKIPSGRMYAYVAQNPTTI